MKKLLILLLLMVLMPFNTLAISKNYQDKVAPLSDVETDNTKINLYLFYGSECPHCEEERKWLAQIKDKYEYCLNIVEFEVWHNESNANLMKTVGEKFTTKPDGVPYTIIGDTAYVGYSDSIASRIESKIKQYTLQESNDDEIKIPILGTVDMNTISIPLVAVILGFIDGFNPCAMWILLFLINMLFNLKDKKKVWILGFTFLFVSGLIYFLSMLGINIVLEVATIKYLKIAIAIFIYFAGIFNLCKYLKMRKKEVGCSVVDNKKRKKIITKVKKIINSKSFIISLIGIIILGVTVNFIELACSLGFPVIFTEILSINNVHGISKIIYLLIYILFYMIDDIIVFVISMITLQATGITNKYNKLCTLVSAIIMIIMGILLILKPEWLMLNF